MKTSTTRTHQVAASYCTHTTSLCQKRKEKKNKCVHHLMLNHLTCQWSKTHKTSQTCITFRSIKKNSLRKKKCLKRLCIEHEKKWERNDPWKRMQSLKLHIKKIVIRGDEIIFYGCRFVIIFFFIKCFHTLCHYYTIKIWVHQVGLLRLNVDRLFFYDI